MITPVNRTLFRTLWSHVAGRVAYLMGAKAPSLTCDSAVFSVIDCSGLSRWLLARATEQGLILPEGSGNQLQWCLDQGLAGEDYQRAGEIDNVLRIHFLTPARAAEVGRPGDRHVWMTINGVTYESHGGGGCIQRPWDTWILAQSDYSFVLPSVPGV